MKHMANSDKTTLERVANEMAKPRMSKSARAAGLLLDTSRLPKLSNVTVAGIVEQIIPSRPNQPERAQIKVHLPDKQYRKLRMENTLTKKQGEHVSLKKGAHVDIIVTTKKRK